MALNSMTGILILAGHVKTHREEGHAKLEQTSNENWTLEPKNAEPCLEPASWKR